MKNYNIYIYDGSFIHLINLINYLVINKIKPYNIKTIDYNPNLFEQLINLNVPINEDNFNMLRKRVGSKVFKIIYYIYLSNHEHKELIIFYFLIYSFKYEDKVLYMRNIKLVNEGLKIAKYVSHENHKFKGFLRFVELQNKVLYAEFAPENNIIQLLSNHFKNRFKNEYFIIKDVKRNIISLYDKKDIYIIQDDNFILSINDICANEKNIEEMWKEFYKTIGIKERKNDRCRMNFMPKKYWQYITEVKDEESSNQ